MTEPTPRTLRVYLDPLADERGYVADRAMMAEIAKALAAADFDVCEVMAGRAVRAVSPSCWRILLDAAWGVWLPRHHDGEVGRRVNAMTDTLALRDKRPRAEWVGDDLQCASGGGVKLVCAADADDRVAGNLLHNFSGIGSTVIGAYLLWHFPGRFKEKDGVETGRG